MPRLAINADAWDTALMVRRRTSAPRPLTQRPSPLLRGQFQARRAREPVPSRCGAPTADAMPTAVACRLYRLVMSPLRLVFADDNYLVREGVTALLAELADIELVEVVSDLPSLMTAVSAHQPDLVLTDIRMPPSFDNEGIVAAKQIRAEYPETGVVVLSQYVEEEYAFELLEEGAAGLGYLLKERVSQREELVRALFEVSRGGSVLDPLVIEGLLARKAMEAQSPLRSLTPRETEVLREMTRGSSNAMIAKTLYMSQRSVEKHIGAVFEKLGLVEEGEVNRRVMAVLACLADEK
jgi:DNA-binding NarL/FixJ family response regulator